MLYSIICTDTQDHIHWQCELLEYSWSKVNQPGELIRLVACNSGDELPRHRHARVIRTNPSNIDPVTGDGYAPYNRLYSLRQWLEEHEPSGTVLIIDPDCVFRRPLGKEAMPGSPVGQHWVNFGIPDNVRAAIETDSNIEINSIQPFTWPALIHTRDLLALMPRWIELTSLFRSQTGGWEVDMFALIVAAAELGLEFELGNTTAWLPWPDDLVGEGPILHYCQPVLDTKGNELWWKNTYSPWERVADTESTMRGYAKDILHLINEYARVKQREALQQDDTIFIAIASYCDPELVTTIESCLEKARKPENLAFGICLQYDDSDDATGFHCLDRFSQDRRFRSVAYHYSESTGGCWARNIAQQLYDGERYTLQIDSHSRMAESWDTKLIGMMDSLPSEKPLITGFPPFYYFEGNDTVFQYIDQPQQLNTAKALEWKEDGALFHGHEVIPEFNVFPRRTRFLSGAFVFTLGQWTEEIRQDPKHFYTGEEFALTLRSFTHGYDLFDANEIVLWTRLHPAPNRKFWNDNDDDRVTALHERGVSRLRLLYAGDPGGELGRYGLGNTRTLEEYRIYAGLDYRTYAIHPDAARGVSPDPVTLHRAAMQHEDTDTMTEDSELIDLRIHLADLPSLELACAENNPVLSMLFQSLSDKSSDPDSIVYLNLGEREEETIQFRKSQLVALETCPSLSESFHAQVERQPPAPPQDEPREFVFDDDWKYWIWHSIRRGCSRDMVFKELILNNFPWEAVRRELNHEPSAPLEFIRSVSQQERRGQDKQLIAHVQRLASDKLEVYSIDGFLTEQECTELIKHMRPRLTASLTADESRTPEVRTSNTCFFGRNDESCPLANEITRRVSKLLGLNPSYAEPIQGHIYELEEEYKPHTDWFSPGTDQFDKNASDEQGGQRTWSALIYLNDVEGGGSTEFPEIGLSVRPRLGKMVFWNNLYPSGEPNPAALHGAKPVQAGSKIVLTQWFRSFGTGECFTRDPAEYIPAYTRTGIESQKIPADLFHTLKAYHDKHADRHFASESVPGGYLKNTAGSNPSELLPLPEALQRRVFDALQPRLEAWSGSPLVPTAVYGIRRYLRGTTLKMHRDINRTHIVSAILNIAKQVDEDWLLEVEDHHYRTHRIGMNPGDMLLYEGGRLLHGRPEPLVGDYYCNLFVHYKPVDYVPPGLLG
jgi:prolyl 4-hydroxylase